MGNKQGAGQTSARLHSSAGPCSSPEAPRLLPEHRLEIREPCGSRRGLTLKASPPPPRPRPPASGTSQHLCSRLRQDLQTQGMLPLKNLALTIGILFVSLPCSLPRGPRTDLLTSPSSSLQQSVCVCVCVCVSVCVSVCVCVCVGELVAGRALLALNDPEVSHHSLPRPHKGVI